ncbi:hypothetical protein SAMN04487948_105240 [Halogranum amylolyticum]|uniref:Uncharacterized protein n=1 Tax=Halogranum amylolyticum TaxID=660520 RepID=A0A1H8SP35_9EURY|nr:hypothetical protein [Halogranum amylolyticum]SEO80482.1 hypothetical protein SAMN04487948_105240 [Halogranum amylolyticum]
MKASTIVMLIGAALTVFGLPIPGLSVLGLIIFILGAVARFLDF